MQNGKLVDKEQFATMCKVSRIDVYNTYPLVLDENGQYCFVFENGEAAFMDEGTYADCADVTMKLVFIWPKHTD